MKQKKILQKISLLDNAPNLLVGCIIQNFPNYIFKKKNFFLAQCAAAYDQYFNKLWNKWNYYIGVLSLWIWISLFDFWCSSVASIFAILYYTTTRKLLEAMLLLFMWSTGMYHKVHSKGTSINDVTHFLWFLTHSSLMSPILLNRLMESCHLLVDPPPLSGWCHLWLAFKDYYCPGDRCLLWVDLW